jgi:hypothetical protein
MVIHAEHLFAILRNREGVSATAIQSSDANSSHGKPKSENYLTNPVYFVKRENKEV